MTVRLASVASSSFGAIGLLVERDIYFEADKPISEYASLAQVAGSITI